MKGLLHIYGQQWWHNDAHLVGTREALADLRDALTAALESGEPERVEVFANDGEGYGAWAILVDEEQMGRMAVPYEDEVARERSETATWPGSLLEMMLHGQRGEGRKRCSR